MQNAQIGVYGLGTMGSALALNLADKGFRVAVANRETDWTAPFIARAGRMVANLVPAPDLKTFVEDRKGHDRRYALDAGKIRRELGWTARHDFDAGIAKTVRWYLDHRPWCESVQVSAEYRRQRLGLGD